MSELSQQGSSGTSVLLREIGEAAEPVAQFWPMKGFVHHNPIHGLEHLPFDDAIRDAEELFGARGYLSNDEYREFYREGRISERGVKRALRRAGRLDDETLTAWGTERVSAARVGRLQLLFDCEALSPPLLRWEMSEGVLERFRSDLPQETRDTLESFGPPERYLNELWSHLMSIRGCEEVTSAASKGRPDEGDAESSSIELPFRRTMSDWVDRLAAASVVDGVNEQMIKWVSVFVDEGLAGWEVPSRSAGFYTAWRELAEHDASGRLLGILRYGDKVRSLPLDAEEAIKRSLDTLGIPEPRWRDFLARALAQLPGWTGLVRYRENNPDEPSQQESPIDVVQYLAVRLFYEVELTQVATCLAWGVDATTSAVAGYWLDRRGEYAAAMEPERSVDGNTRRVCQEVWRLFQLGQFLAPPPDALTRLTRVQTDTLLQWLEAFPAERHGPVWLEAYEDNYRERTLATIASNRGRQRMPERPLAQASFCIDVRSEPFRRHLEAAGSYETFGYAGFFGIPISHRVFDTDESVALCPVLLKPQHASFEVPRRDQAEALSQYAAGSRWQRLGEHLFHDLKQNPIAAFMLVDVLGLFFSLKLLGKTLVRRPYEALVRAARRWFVPAVATEIPLAADDEADPAFVTSLIRGFTIDEHATFVENGLRTMGLTSNLGRFIVLCGHGGNSDNNPYFAALHCGACGGRPGDPNARAFAAMGNHPEVRRVLSERGIRVPEDTWFLGAKHDTNTDRVALYDLEDVPESHLEDLRTLRRDLERAGAMQAQNRCRGIPGAPRGMNPEQAYAHVEARSFDWANPRPEWGLAGNAGFIIGRRALTEGLDLEGRIFLNSYDPAPDPEGAILEKIMTAPLIVGEWISMEHYFSAADPWSYGSGSKVIHNVVSGVGLMAGGQSDLQTGLPLQTVNDGDIHHHEPMRLLAIIEAKPEIIGAIIKRHDILQQLFHNEWVNLVALEPETFSFHRYRSDGSWEGLETDPSESTFTGGRAA